MSEEYAIHWLEDIIDEIIKRKQNPIVISAGKTPSGHVHIGFMRELIIGDSISRILKKKRKTVNFRIFFDSFDAAKRFPPYITKQYAKKYIGKPFALIPPPFDDIPAQSYGEYFGKELANSLREYGIKIDVIWTHDLYQTKEMHEKIRIGLQKQSQVKSIILSHLTHALSEEEKEEKIASYKNWMPAMVVCENCGRTQIKNDEGEIIPNRVIKYFKSKDMVSYVCPACEHHGEESISSGKVKLNWRLDWPAKWSLDPKNVYEGSGKDHFTKITGSWDVAVDLTQQIYGYEGPVGLGFEWIRLGDSDMGTSKGVVIMPKTYSAMGEAEILRMLVLTTNPTRHISFRIEELALLYDEFERIERVYYNLEEPFDIQKKIEEYKERKKKELIKEWESDISKEINRQIKEERDVDKKKAIVKTKKKYIKNKLDDRLRSDLDSSLGKYIQGIEKNEMKEFNRQKKEIEFLYPLIRAKRVTSHCPPQIPLKFLVNMVQLKKFISFDEILRKAQHTQVQKNIPSTISKSYLQKRLRQTANWLKHIKNLIEYAPSQEEKDRLSSKVDIFDVPKTVTRDIINQLELDQKDSLKVFYTWVNSIDELTENNLKDSMIKIREKTGIDAKRLFQAIYLVLIGRLVGPRLGPFMSMMDLQWIQDRFSVFR